VFTGEDALNYLTVGQLKMTNWVLSFAGSFVLIVTSWKYICLCGHVDRFNGITAAGNSSDGQRIGDVRVLIYLFAGCHPWWSGQEWLHSSGEFFHTVFTFSHIDLQLEIIVIILNTGEARETICLFQGISVLVQRFNAVCCMTVCQSLTAWTNDRTHLCIA